MKKTSFKKRIKRALANLLKDELLEFIGYERNYPPINIPAQIRIKEIEFDTLVLERQLDLSKIMYSSRMNPEIEFEDELERCKQEMLKEVEKCIHVETLNLTSPEYRMQRSVRMILRVQKPQI